MTAIRRIRNVVRRMTGIRVPDYPTEPIRSELFGPERLGLHARRMAGRHRPDRRIRLGAPVLDRLEDNERCLRDAYDSLAEAVRRDEAVSPAAEWLLDNFHVVEAEVREARTALPEGYQRQLPKLRRGELANHPRVYAVAQEYVAHTDSRFDPKALRAFLEAYQQVSPLTMGEVWAVPSSLRLVLIENLRRLAVRIVGARVAREEADRLAEEIQSAVGSEGGDPLDPLRRFDRREDTLDRAFLVELSQRLRETDGRTVAVAAWLEEYASRSGVWLEELVRKEHDSQLAAQATVANIVTSMRKISAFDWADFFEAVSVTERLLRDDPAGVYPTLDFATRDAYRHAVEELARGSGLREEEVARRSLRRVRAARRSEAEADSGSEGRSRYLGFHLTLEGRAAFEADLGYRVALSRRLRQTFVAWAFPGYFGTLALLTAVLLALPLTFAASEGVAVWGLVALGLASLVPATELAIAVLHQDVTDLVPPDRLPKLELSEGVTERLKTVVAVPVLLEDEEQVRTQVERLEERYLANSEGHLAFALLSDWSDAPEERMPGDEELLGTAAALTQELNDRHGPAPDGRSRFLLLHRRRVWSDTERQWMGWERKRGKLEELNELLRGSGETTHLLREDGLTDVPTDARFVLVLDADTRLPPGAARRLVGTMAHPLNRPRFDEESGRVTKGYGILQPRITALLPGAGEGSRYHDLYAGPTGIDPYASASSNVYQDLFGEGTFVGKGLYDIDAFREALDGRVPEGTLLSHDHFEGAFARCGLVSDVELFDEFPTRYEANASRLHRWARGDWQLLPWILGRGPAVKGRDVPATPPFLDRWKMVDNLRRTLSTPSSVLMLLLGWLLLPGAAWVWTGFVAATIAVPAGVPVAGGLMPGRRGTTLRAHVGSVAREAGEALARAGLEVAFLAYHAGLMVDAIVRTIVRVHVTRRYLLEWTPAALAARGLGAGVVGAYRRMWRPVSVSVAAAALVALLRPGAAPPALLLAAAWTFAPTLARWLSRPVTAPEPERIAGDELIELRLVARESWRYFEETVGPETNGLPPDNLQLDPEPRIAHRTSPTNVGVYLLSVVAARDLGWIGTRETADRIRATLEALEGLDRVRGHFLNWYDVRTLVPLEPRYVSTVDSGNLVGHLLTVAESCREYRDGPAPPEAVREGLADAVRLTRRAYGDTAGSAPDGTVSRRDVEAALARLEGEVEGMRASDADGSGLLDEVSEIEETAASLEEMAEVAAGASQGAGWDAVRFWAGATRRCAAGHARDARGPTPVGGELTGDGTGESELDRDLRLLAARADAMAREADFRLVYDPERKLFSIGYRVREAALDEGYYDLLASEARLASLVAVATGDVEVGHWFHLGRQLTRVDHGAALVSWSGSMFEYLMPHLVVEPPPGTMLERTQRLVVRRQVEYGTERGIPWGISESAYNARDLQMTYQYSHFGVPGLGLTRGLSEDLVVSPYATALAAMVAPRKALGNFRRLADLGARGAFGFFEALDFTPERLSADERYAVVRAYMAHHQGMTVAALANVVQAGRLRARFHRVPVVRSVEVLLQERVPRGVPVSRPRREEVEAVRHVRDLTPPVVRRFTSPHRRPPDCHLLSNGRYSVMLTAAGAGYSRCGELSVTRWHADPTLDAMGSFVYVRDSASGEVWSAGWQPVGGDPDSYEAVFSEDRAVIRRRDGAVSTTLEVVVSPEEDGEMRRLTLQNQGSRAREFEVTSYSELVLAPSEADAAHPAFEKLFVETAFHSTTSALLATRRRRSPDERKLWASHVMAVEGETVGPPQYETDRARFLDRGRELRAPASVREGRPLSGSTGPVLDPVFSLRRTVRIGPGGTARVTFATHLAGTREEAVNRAEVHRDPASFERAAGLAWTHAQVQLQHLGVTPDEAHLFQRLASRLLYPDPTLRPTARRGHGQGKGQKTLWRYGISGDRPLLLVRIDQVRDRELVRQLLRAHDYWGWKGLLVDLVILNEHPVSYVDELQDWIRRQIQVRSPGESGPDGSPATGEVHLLRGADMPAEDRAFVRAAAGAVLHARDGSLAEQLEAVQRSEEPVVAPPPVTAPAVEPAVPPPGPELAFFNGLGGFADGGSEYVVTLGEGQWTPTPWVNVVANQTFGFLATESGSGFTWAVNSREHRLTPWSNDPVTDPAGEVFYVRDEETGELWTPTPLPIREATPYRVTHSQGWTRFEHWSHGITLELTQFVPTEDPVKVSRLCLRNESGRTRRLSVTAFVEWVLGVHRHRAAPHVRTSLDEETDALLAESDWEEDFAGRAAFADMAGGHESWTADRTEFLGRNGSRAAPAALASGPSLSERAGLGLDPCAALRRSLTLAPGEEAEVTFLLGEGEDRDAARALIIRYREADLDSVLEEVRRSWDDILGAVEVEVPEASLEPMLNRWLLYQTLSCRVLGRSAFYQSGGAYGFRDQLQDVMALTVPRRDVAREHLLRAAGRQFPEGDVQHWWHPPSGRGVRTRISDDLLWLPFVSLHYLEVTGDRALLDERLPFLEGPPLKEDEQERYFEPAVSDETATFFEHCARAVDARLEAGPHGLPLMGAGDWNDGMNRVGRGGRGESVWLGWFLHLVLQGFVPLAEERGEDARAEAWRRRMDELAEALERHAWDGDWYRRAFFDDGTPLGSSVNEECRIDSIAQSWAVLSGAARPSRQVRAMQSVEQYLVRRGDALVLLFTPPFSGDGLDPGYIRGYVPGVRENGGQYTHAALWSVLAFAELGLGDEAVELLSILNPVNQAGTRAGMHRYKVEPYVSAGDVYSEPPHAGRGGWTWYTGSAGWMYRAGIEWILGFRLRGDTLRMDPCIPRDWPGFRINFRYHSTRYVIDLESPGAAMRGVSRVEVDGRKAHRSPGGEGPEGEPGGGASGDRRPRVDHEGAWIPLVDDGATHRVRVVLTGGEDDGGETPDTRSPDSPAERHEALRTDGEVPGY